MTAMISAMTAMVRVFTGTSLGGLTSILPLRGRGRIACSSYMRPIQGLHNAAGTITQRGVRDAGAAVAGDWVSATTWLNGTVTMTGDTATITIGTPISGTARTGSRPGRA